MSGSRTDFDLYYGLLAGGPTIDATTAKKMYVGVVREQAKVPFLR